jgi:parvulin-like peptidyl-prolyl isomerase
MMPRHASGLLVCGLGLLGPLGCVGNEVHTLDSHLFVPANASSELPDIPIEPGGAIIAGERQPATTAASDSPKNISILPAPTTGPFDAIAPLEALQPLPTTGPSDPLADHVTDPPATDAQAVQASAVLPPQPPAATSQPADAQAAARKLPVDPGPQPAKAPSVYMTLGCVLTVVNDTPIYANQVLAPLDKALTAKARELSPQAFKEYAVSEIEHQLQEMIEDELYFAVAYHGLTEEDKKIAKAITMEIRQEKITAAGGSVEEARKRSLDDGLDFDDALQQDYRRVVHARYQAKQIEPLIQVTADDMREYYRLNAAKLYSDQDRAQFRVLMIDPAAHGGVQPALEKINAIREKALSGADFAALASADNDNAFLKGRGGNPADAGEWIDRKTYPIDAVMAAVWQIQPGQVTPVVQTNDGLYIAKLEAKHIGITRPFEDPTVQDDIYTRLHQQQLADHWRKSKADSFSDSMVVTDTDRLEIALEMAMQKYAAVH